MNFWSKYVVPKDKSTSLPMPDLNTVDISDKAIERRIVRKQDLRILPWICVCYLLSACQPIPTPDLQY
jgi:hypothetical protein